MGVVCSGHSGYGGALSASSTVAVGVVRVNQPIHVVSVAALVIVPQDVPLNVSFSLVDPDAFLGWVYVDVGAVNGTLALPLLAPLVAAGAAVITAGAATNATRCAFNATLVDASSVLTTMTFVGQLHYAGPAAVTVTASDNGPIRSPWQHSCLTSAARHRAAVV
jgi:hypothetical protein